VSRFSIPEFIHEVIDDPRQRGVLIAGAVSMFAVGLVPRVLQPGLPTAQELIKSQPEIQTVFLLLSFISAATVIVGGLVSDIFRRRELLLGSLVVMLVTALLSIVVDDGAIFYVAGFISVAASGIVLAFAIGSVAVAYQGVPRATALGIVYAAYGGAAALAPILLTIILVRFPAADPTQPDAFTFETWPAYVASAITAGIALWAARHSVPHLPGTLPASRPLIVAIALWSISILAIVVGVLGFVGPGDPLIPFVLLGGGVIGLGTMTLRFNRTAELIDRLQLDRRALGVALAIGIIVGFVQTIPLILLPALFERALGYGQILAIFAIAPFAIALFIAGPVSGFLLQRFGPRGVIAFGTAIIGLGNVILAGFLMWAGQETHYIAFVVPLIFIGAGFVFSTTVRTAIVFASTPLGLPASAAAINEASVALGSRVGVVAGTTAVVLSAVRTAERMVVDRPDAEALVAEFRGALEALGTPRFEEVITAAIEGADTLKLEAYVVAYIDGIEVALLGSGIIGIIGAIAAWFLTGRRDPLKTVFEMQDERVATPQDTQPNPSTTSS
jgi:MFS family permease